MCLAADLLVVRTVGEKIRKALYGCGICCAAQAAGQAAAKGRREADDLRARTHNNQKLQLPVILKTCHIYLLFCHFERSRKILLYRFKKRIRLVRIKHLIAIHHRHQVLRLGKIDDIMRVPR